MKRLALLLPLLWALNSCAQNDAPTVTIDGKKVPLPLVYKDEKQRAYALERTFVENETTYLYREYAYYKCDTCSTEVLYSSYYFIRPKEQKDYAQYLHKNTYWLDDDIATHKEYFAEAYRYLRESRAPLERQQLDNVPRYWYQAVKYHGQFYLSVDAFETMELTDSMVIYRDMELSLSALRNFSRHGSSYSWTEEPEYLEGAYEVSLRPSQKVKGLYVVSVKQPDGTVGHSVWVPEEAIHHFDYIDWRSTDHIPEGLEYDQIDYDAL